VNCELLLIRHGEVANPNHVVYGDLPGFHLSTAGVLQAHRTAEHLADRLVDVVLTSPLDRSVETATAIARHHDIEPTVDIRLTESGQFPHWTGHRWELIPALFPGELERYLEDAGAVPAQATRLVLTGRDLAELRTDPPEHAEVIWLSRDEEGTWTEMSRWSPTAPIG